MNKEPAKQIIAALEDRGGFDSWWYQIDKEDKKEIIDEIAQIIDEHIEFNYR